jgi:hypothetical protein
MNERLGTGTITVRRAGARRANKSQIAVWQPHLLIRTLLRPKARRFQPRWLALIAIAGLVGATLALRFNVLSPAPATALLLAIVAISLVIVVFATAASLQLGYFATSLLRMLLLGKGRPTPISGDRQPQPAAPRLVPGQPDREITIEAARPPTVLAPPDSPAGFLRARRGYPLTGWAPTKLPMLWRAQRYHSRWDFTAACLKGRSLAYQFMRQRH